MKEWSDRRARLNHDLISNKLLLRLAALECVADGKVITCEDTLDEVRLVWDHVYSESVSLCSSFLVEMTPRALFKKPPLDRCTNETKLWLAPFVHERWIASMKALDLVDLMWQAIDNAQLSMNTLFVVTGNDRYSVRYSAEIRTARISVLRLSEILSSMPKAILP